MDKHTFDKSIPTGRSCRQALPPAGTEESAGAMQQLADRFLDGLTTLAEEQRLYRWFATADVPPALQPLRELMLDLGAAAPVTESSRPEVPVHRVRWGRRLAAAAAVFLLVVLSGTLVFRRHNDCVMEVYGQRVTDREAVMREVDGSMSALATGSTDVEGELRTVFGNP